MGERYSATIEIGGKIKRALLPELVAACESDGVSSETTQAEVGEEDFVNAAKAGETIQLFDHQASYGQFTDLESWCQKNGVTYQRVSSPHYDIDGETAFWKPGMADPTEVSSTGAGYPYVTLNDLIEIHKAGTIFIDAVIRSIEEKCGEVPALEIVEDQ
jgi:hypothetical protein